MYKRYSIMFETAQSVKTLDVQLATVVITVYRDPIFSAHGIASLSPLFEIHDVCDRFLDL